MAAFLVLAVWAVLGALTGCDRTPSTTTHLELDPASKPYELVTVHCTKLDPRTKPGAVVFALGDIDGDGLPERIEGNHQKFLGYDSEGGTPIKPRWEIHLPDDHYLDDELPSFGVCRDINGDKVEELFFVTRNKDSSRWNLVGLDVLEHEFFLNRELPRGEDRRRPAGWDGVWAAVGFLESTGPGTDPALLLMHRSGYDATYRGFCAVSPGTGEVLWDFISGAQPNTESVRIVDLDEDGQQEICWATTAPNNWGGRQVNGISDDRAHVLVLNNRGQLLFKQEVAILFSGGGLQTWDLNGDGIKELVVATDNGATGGNCQLAIFDWARESVVATQRRLASFRGVALCPGPREGAFWLYSGSNNGTVSRFLFEEGRLTQDGQLLTEESLVTVLGQADFLPDPGAEVVVNVGNEGHVVVLSPGLKQLAVLPGERFGDKTHMTLLSNPVDRPRLILASHSAQWALDYRGNPHRYLGTLKRLGWVLLAVVLVVGAYRLGVVMGRRPRGSTGISAEPAATARTKGQADRQALFSVYRELSDIHHQVVGPAKGLQRLVWLMNAYTTEIGDSAAMEQRIRQVALDFKESVHPALVSLFNTATGADFEIERVENIRTVLESLARRMDRLVSGGLDAARVQDEQTRFQEEWGQVEKGLGELREIVNAHFTTDPVRMFEGLILIRTEEFERQGIVTEIQGRPAGRSAALARIDSSDLRFVLDNLLDNAQRALANVPEGRLVVQVSREEREIALHISDNGVGIAPELHQKIFSRRFTSHDGGGRGLFRSREILAKWGGEIILADSQPGQGTTFVVKLLAAGESANLRSSEARA